MLCAVCDVPMHRDCWQESSRCPAFGCLSTAVEDPAIRLYRPRVAPATMVVAPAGPLPAAQAREEMIRIEERLGDMSWTAARDSLGIIGGVALMFVTGFLGYHTLFPVALLMVLGTSGVFLLRNLREMETARTLRRRLDRLRDELPIDELLPPRDR